MQTTKQTDMPVAPDAHESRAANQQKAIEDRFSGFLREGPFLNIGSGQAPMIGEEWTNVDSNPEAPHASHIELLDWWDIPDNTYQAIAAIHVLEHFSGDELFHIFYEAGRVLKPGGHILAVVPYGMHSYHYSNPFHKQIWVQGTPMHFDGRLYKMAGTQSYKANQEKRLHPWSVSNFTFLPSKEWQGESEEILNVAMSRYLNVILEMSFVMTLEAE